MKLSVIIPVYNVEAYVGKTLASVFNTTAPTDAFEVIVVNDGTQDGSMEVVRKFSDRPNITILEQGNQGLGAARMNGLALAKGEYVWFVDSDDYLVTDGVGKVLHLLEERKDADVLMFPLLRVEEDASGNWLDLDVDGERVVEGRKVIKELGLSVSTSQRFVLKRSLTDNPWLFFPAGLIHEDEYFGPVLMCLAKCVHILSEPVYCHTCYRPGSIMSSLSVRSSYDMVSVHQLLMRFMESNLDPEDHPWFRSYAFRRLLKSYSRSVRNCGASEINRFVRQHGRYVWDQWRRANPEAPLRKKAGRFLYFTKPALYTKWIHR